MNVLFVASEAVPFIKTGGLADVMGALPKALAKKGMDVRLVIPKYSRIAEEAKKQMKEVTTGIVNLGLAPALLRCRRNQAGRRDRLFHRQRMVFQAATASTATAMTTNASPISAAPS
jgi:glycogen synthase